MRLNVSMSRVAIAAVVVAAAVAGSGCKWFHKPNKLYAGDAQSRPLEVPPDLDAPRTDAAVAVPGAPAMASTATPAAVSNGFNVAGSRDEVFTKVGDELAKIEGLTVASRAQLLGVYDVAYEGSNFLVRVTATNDASYVSAVDPRGQTATGEAPTKVITALKAALGGN